MVPVMWPCIHWSWLVTLHSVHHVSPHPTLHPPGVHPGGVWLGAPRPPGHHAYEGAVGVGGGAGHQGAAAVPLHIGARHPSHNIGEYCHLTRVLAGGGGAEHAGGDLPAVVHRPRARGVAHGLHPGLDMGTCDDILSCSC